MIGGSSRECIGGFAACGLLRKNFPQYSPDAVYSTPVVNQQKLTIKFNKIDNGLTKGIFGLTISNLIT